MARIVIMDVLITLLLFGGALLLLLWKKEVERSDKKFIHRIGLGIGVMGFKEIVNIACQVVFRTETFFTYSILVEIAGIVIIMLALFNYLEASLK